VNGPFRLYIITPAPIAIITPTVTRLIRPLADPPNWPGAALPVLEGVLLEVPEAVSELLLLVVLSTRAVSLSSATKEPVTPLVLVQELGRFELTPDTNLTTAH
jgi:hypothetical protein